MGSLVQDFKKQASFFFKEKINRARLVLMDVTPAQLLTEEMTNGETLTQDSHAMRLISRAAFEVDDYERIVQILHHRLSKFDRCNWRGAYKGLVLLEHLLTHGPQRIAEEFQSDEQIIRDMASFNYVDDKGFNWGLSVKKKSERIMRLLDDKSYLKQERDKTRKLIVGIKGFGSFNKTSPIDENSKNVSSDKFFRSKTLFFNDRHEMETKLLASHEYDKLILMTNESAGNDIKGWSRTYTSQEYVMGEDHPFWDKEPQTRVSLLSSI